MEAIYRGPLRVYLILGFAALVGIFCGLKLPISLFPNSSQPIVAVNIPYGDLSQEEFSLNYGPFVEGPLKGIQVDNFRVSELTTQYRDSGVQFLLTFDWGCDGEKAGREVKNVVSALNSSWPEEIRKGTMVHNWSENTGFLAISFYSPQRSLDEIYDLVKPNIAPQLNSVNDAEGAEVYNPQQKKIEVKIDLNKMAAYQVLTTDISRAITNSNIGLSGGSLTTQEAQTLQLVFPKNLKNVEDIKNISVTNRFNRSILLKEVASVRQTVDTKSLRFFHTSGVSSIIVFAQPKAGGNIKKMSDDILQIIESQKNKWPSDIEYKILVNPSEFIKSSVQGVIHEVGLAALLAVVILFLFIGSLKNVATAAIEIPISIVMAFIFMKFFDMNLNLISLGGLALSAGMNVDASVVVMENIFRHFNAESHHRHLSFDEKVKIVVAAVKEVMAPILSSTVASLVVFIPLVATNGLTNSILGDLAKAVIFSHSLSAIVALVLVPTVRLQMLQGEAHIEHKSPIEFLLVRLESLYKKTLLAFLNTSGLRYLLYTLVIAALPVLALTILPKLPKEIIGSPESDWVMLSMRSQVFTEAQQMNSFVEKVESDILNQYESDIQYTFAQVQGANNSNIMLRLKSKKNMAAVWKRLEEQFTNTPEVSYFVFPWNPSELSLPNPPHFRLEITGGNGLLRTQVANDLKLLLQENNLFPRVRTWPGINLDEKILSVEPNQATLFELSKKERGITPSDLSDYLRVVTEGKTAGYLSLENKIYGIQLSVEKYQVQSLEDIKGLPLGLEKKVLPLSALAKVEFKSKSPGIYRLNQGDIFAINAYENESNKQNIKPAQQKATTLVNEWKNTHAEDLVKKQVTVSIQEPDIELNRAIDQLKVALLISICLVFITMVFQFGDLVHALLVLVSIPLGIIGVLLSLWIFKSTLSLNSVLGIILLNGITVANSVILVDFMKKLHESGRSPLESAIESSQARLRPILMTSLTTILGMLPIAFGMGEGGKILQPLGIAVSGGLWVSMLLTLFIVPALQYGYLKSKLKRKAKNL